MRTLVAILLLTSLVALVNAFAVRGGDAAPEARKSRPRRSGISDQRLAELETLIALSNMRSKYLTVPVAYGVIDPERIGKRKRSSSDHRPAAVSRTTNGHFVHGLLRRLRNSRPEDQK